MLFRGVLNHRTPIARTERRRSAENLPLRSTMKNRLSCSHGIASRNWRPLRGRMRRHVEVKNLACADFQDGEDVKHAKADGDYVEEILSDDLCSAKTPIRRLERRAHDRGF